MVFAQPAQLGVASLLHFILLNRRSEADTPFGRELRRLGIAHKFVGYPVNMRYRSRLGLALRVYPQILWSSLRAVTRSLVMERVKPAAIFVSTDVQAIAFGLACRLLGLRPKIIFQTLILSPKHGALARAAQRVAYSVILNLIDGAICHSRAEVSDYRKAFPKARCEFHFIPYGTTVTRRSALIDRYRMQASEPNNFKIVTAGRSGRDYLTLVEAIKNLDCHLDIVCDTGGPVKGIRQSDQVKLWPALYNEQYLELLSSADIVAIPLASDDISAGQMVLLQALAIHKPVIITKTRTTVDYVQDGVDALMVSLGNVAELRAAIVELMKSSDLRARLALNAGNRFTKDFSTEVYVGRLTSLLAQHPEVHETAAGGTLTA